MNGILWRFEDPRAQIGNRHGASALCDLVASRIRIILQHVDEWLDSRRCGIEHGEQDDGGQVCLVGGDGHFEDRDGAIDVGKLRIRFEGDFEERSSAIGRLL